MRPSPTAPVIMIESLTKRFGDTLALDAVSLAVPRGVVFGYLGPNGAGKTTTIRVLMGSLRPSSGRVEVLGADPFTAPVEVHARVGYLPGEFAPYPDLTGVAYLGYLAALRGGVDPMVVEQLAKRLRVDLHRPIGSLSHGNRQKIGLLQAFMHEPDLVLLDEPTLGLDPLMQREFIELVDEAREAGTTIFLSSHILDEVEAVADLVGIVRDGRLLVVEEVDALKRRARRRVDLTFAGLAPAAALRAAEGVVEVEQLGSAATVTVEGSMEGLMRAAAPHGIVNVVSHEVDLEEIFLRAYEGGGR